MGNCRTFAVCSTMRDISVAWGSSAGLVRAPTRDCALGTPDTPTRRRVVCARCASAARTSVRPGSLMPRCPKTRCATRRAGRAKAPSLAAPSASFAHNPHAVPFPRCYLALAKHPGHHAPTRPHFRSLRSRSAALACTHVPSRLRWRSSLLPSSPRA